MGTEIFERIIEEVKNEVSSRMYEKLTTEELIRYADIESVSVERRNISQNWMFNNIYPLVASGELVVLDSIWTESWGYHSDKPVFLDIKSYNEWMACKTSNERNEYNRRHPRSFNEDSSFYDGYADVYCFGNYRNAQMVGIKDNRFDKDIIGIEIYKKENDRDLYCSDSSSSMYGMKRSRSSKCLFTLKPTNKTLKERRAFIVEMFRTQIASRIAREKTDEYMQRMITKIADEVMDVKCEKEQKELYKYHISRPINIV